MKKKTLIITSVIVILVLIFILSVILTIKKWGREKEEMISRCYTYDREANKYGSDIVDCYGYISIHYVDDHYSVNDLRFMPGIPIAVMNSLKQYKVVNEKMYVLNRDGISWYVKNNKLEYLDGNPHNRLLKYVIFNTQTGDTEFYASLDEIPPEARSIFKELNRYDDYKK